MRFFDQNCARSKVNSFYIWLSIQQHKLAKFFVRNWKPFLYLLHGKFAKSLLRATSAAFQKQR